VTIVVNEAGGEVTTVEIRVAASSEDAEERASGSIRLTSRDLELVYDGRNQIQWTPNIASVIQGIVNRPGWSNGNSLVIINHRFRREGRRVV
jgi:hypothetical protein